MQQLNRIVFANNKQNPYIANAAIKVVRENRLAATASNKDIVFNQSLPENIQEIFKELNIKLER